MLAQECIRYNKLVDVMELTLPQLDKALQGLVVMSGELEAMGNSIALGQVPGAWEAKAYPSLKPLGPWTDDLMLRLDFIRAWIASGIPVTFWISGFYFPQAFLTGSMQNYARSKQYPIDTIAFDFLMLDTFSADSITTKPTDGVYIRGLFLEGARWDPEIRSLNDSRPKQLFSPAPIMHLSPCKDRQEPTGGIYRCPIYKVLSRRGVLSTTGHSTYRGVLASHPRKKDHHASSLVETTPGRRLATHIHDCVTRNRRRYELRHVDRDPVEPRGRHQQRRESGSTGVGQGRRRGFLFLEVLSTRLHCIS